MKRIVKLAVLVAALGVFASVATGSASANTVLCYNAHSPCDNIAPAGSYYTLLADEAIEGSKFVMAGGGSRFECKIAAIGAESQVQAGEPLPVNVRASLERCSASIEGSTQVSCTGKFAETTGNLYHTESSGDWVEIRGRAKQLSFECMWEGQVVTSCTYTNSGTNLYMVGQANGDMAIENEALYRTSQSGLVACPMNATLNVRGKNASARYPEFS